MQIPSVTEKPDVFSAFQIVRYGDSPRYAPRVFSPSFSLGNVSCIHSAKRLIFSEVAYLKHMSTHTAIRLFKNLHAPDQMRCAVFDREYGFSFARQESVSQFSGQFLKASCGIFRMFCMKYRNGAQPLTIPMFLLFLQKL